MQLYVLICMSAMQASLFLSFSLSFSIFFAMCLLCKGGCTALERERMTWLLRVLCRRYDSEHSSSVAHLCRYGAHRETALASQQDPCICCNCKTLWEYARDKELAVGATQLFCVLSWSSVSHCLLICLDSPQSFGSGS